MPRVGLIQAGNRRGSRLWIVCCLKTPPLDLWLLQHSDTSRKSELNKKSATTATHWRASSQRYDQLAQAQNTAKSPSQANMKGRVIENYLKKWLTALVRAVSSNVASVRQHLLSDLFLIAISARACPVNLTGVAIAKKLSLNRKNCACTQWCM